MERNESIEEVLSGAGRRFDSFGDLVREVQRQQSTYTKEDLGFGIINVTADLIAACRQYVATYGVTDDEENATLTEKICSTLLSEYDYEDWGSEELGY